MKSELTTTVIKAWFNYDDETASCLDLSRHHEQAARVLSALASKGGDAMPSAEEANRAWLEAIGPGALVGINAVLDLIRSRLAPIFAAKDVERDALRARVADLEAEVGAAAKAMRDARERLESDLVEEGIG